jgi:plastocyanin
MLRVLGLLLMTALFLCSTSCAPADRQTNAPTTPASTTSPTATATATTSPPTTPSPTAPTTASVKGSDFKWVDDTSGTNVTTIKVGGTVTWTATGDHTLERVAPGAANGCDELDASFDADDMSQPVSRTFNKVGTFGYRCGVHGGVPNCKTPPGSGRMPGIIKVVP